MAESARKLPFHSGWTYRFHLNEKLEYRGRQSSMWVARVKTAYPDFLEILVDDTEPALIVNLAFIDSAEVVSEPEGPYERQVLPTRSW
ncbi:MAG: hypothetical protein QM753_16050 [Thermomicrobiales bacterium]